MRLWLPILALAALGLSSPASADVTARYGGTGKYAPTMSIAVDASGQVRADGGPPDNAPERIMLIRRAGVDYVSAADAQGRFVARKDDMLAIVNEMVAGSLPANARGAMRGLADIRIEIVEGGSETVAGRQGRVYRIAQVLPPGAHAAAAAQPDPDTDTDAETDEDGGPPQIPPFEIVISDDPALAPVGREMARLFEDFSTVAAAAFGTEPAAIAQIRGLLARGTLIRAGDQLRLRSVSTDALPDSAFAVPGPVLTRAQLRARAPQPPPADDTNAD